MAIATVGQVVDILNALEIPNTNLKWKNMQAPKPPYVVLVPHESRNVYADQSVWREARRYDLELYTRDRDIVTEKTIAGALKDAGIVFSSDVVENEENKFVVAYFSTTLIEQEAE